MTGGSDTFTLTFTAVNGGAKVLTDMSWFEII